MPAESAETVLNPQNSKCCFSPGLTESGLLNPKCELVVPAEYADAEGFSEKWAAGFILTESTKEDYDYQSYGLFVDDSNRQYYMIERVDLCYSAQKVGTFTRGEWASAMAYGDYLFVTDRSGHWAWYSKDGVRSESADFSEFYYDNDRKAVIHSATGRVAFAPECELTEDEIKANVWVTTQYDYPNRLLDLKGNELADFSAYSYVTPMTHADLIQTSLDQDNDYKYTRGIADRTGKELVPCLYESLYEDRRAISAGYCRAVRDGKEGFVSLADGKETGFLQEAFSGKIHSLFLEYEDKEKGEITLVSAAAGELPEKYKCTEEKSGYMLVTKMDDSVHLIDMNGTDVLPADADLSQCVTVSNDSTKILLSSYHSEEGRYIYSLYTVSRE